MWKAAGGTACASALAFCAAGNLACWRPFRPPFQIRDEFLALQHRCRAVDEAEENRGEALAGYRLPQIAGQVHAVNGQSPRLRRNRLRHQLTSMLPLVGQAVSPARRARERFFLTSGDSAV